ncbi:MAG TPA: hypothetical protein PLB46_10430 [Chitinophagales bacterium]|nr:hypothetical protein [Chitinophagales bacterium]
MIGHTGCEYPLILRSSDSLDSSDYKISKTLMLTDDSLSQTGVIYKRRSFTSSDDNYFLYLYSKGKVEVYNNCSGKDFEFCKEVEELYSFTDSSKLFFEVYYFGNKHFYEWKGILEDEDLVIYRIHYRNQIGWKKLK